ncbi:MAG: L,D-transpeptidase family protein [Lentibacter algarum]|jgi:murein L,D-transpeptidase YafK|uniref:L,D-transpeptidase family protein n=1 Tax=Lentibacter algarum TaxID=576131 RepID=UPI002353392F|nr:L,D-transpeptidase family protein [Lentibacter algarum]MCO4776141.1 L,D-transpeptidase family protein [Lentibacter algarum]
MRAVKLFGVLLSILLMAGCSSSKFKSYTGPAVTQVLVEKDARKLYLLNGTRVLKSYNVHLGFSPRGHKSIEGDGRTPEGQYIINRRNPNSEFHLSIGISYPNVDDIARARALGKSPGGDIFIHGRPKKYRDGKRDWTAGCIAVTDRQMEEIYSMVKNGTPILIKQ